MKILYLAPISYDNLKQRPQYLAEELSKKHNIVYVDPTVSVMKYLLKGGDKPFGYRYRINAHLEVMRMNGMLSLHRCMESVWKGFSFWERYQIQKLIQWADAIWVGYCPWFNLVCNFKGMIIYDKMDDDIQITKNSMLKRLIAEVEPKLIHRADHIFVSAQVFKDRIANSGKKAVLIPNAVEIQYKKNTPAKKWADQYRIFGYVGMISHWFDMGAIKEILNADINNYVVLVGPTEIPRFEHKRLEYVGRVTKDEVGNWIAAFDVCLYPFKNNEFLDTINPVKIYEYLAQNKPVLAVKSVETEALHPNIALYESSEQLKILLTSNLKQPFSSEEEINSFLINNNWGNRTKQILEEIEYGNS
ncbi:hypothetical protein [Agathobaculum sp. Marseille-P7918]|uniref:hypothetical protein n=1 Tax=Agathobaculum sp. Marseille-P7918 TaxID=2479843 RepID=UPI000F636C34|nr:hypothetical protein [Agathobaculum sp. Marseille-P7918]